MISLESNLQVIIEKCDSTVCMMFRYFHDMGSLELVVIRDRKTWNGFEEAGTRIATSNLLLQDLTEKHAVNASCFLYDESQRFVGTLFVQVQVDKLVDKEKTEGEEQN